MGDFRTGFDAPLLGLGLALCLGLLVGLEREWSDDKPLGLRSFGLVALLGGLAALFAPGTGPWLVVAGLLALAVLLGFWLRGEALAGATTLVAAPVVYLIGAAAVAGHWLHAIVTAGAVTLLLHWKGPMHAWVDRLGRADIETVARFVLLTLVVLPVLPNRTFGPWDVFNPFEAWLLVVLIVTINLAGFLAVRFGGTRKGGWVAGVLGGLVSSTAATVSYANLSRRDHDLGAMAALVILVASTVVYARVLLELVVLAPPLARAMLWPSLTFAAVLLCLAGAVHLRSRRVLRRDVPEQENPAGIKVAMSFGALYVALLFAVAATRQVLGEEALYGVAILSGLMDVDALTLSMGKLYDDGSVAETVAWRSIFLASLANLLFKTAVAAVIGAPTLRRLILPSGGAALAIGVAIVLLWP